MLKDRIKLIKEKLNISSSKALAEAIGMPLHQLKDIERGKTASIKPQYAEKLEEIFHISGWWLLTGKGDMFKSEQKVNNPNFCDDDCVEIGYIEDMVASAGGGGDAEGVGVKMVKVSRFMLKEFNISNFKRANLIKVFGDSMEPLFQSGDIAVVERVDSIEEVRNGSIVIATIDRDVYIKRIEKDPFKKKIVLKSENRLYADIVAEGAELERVKINSIVRGKMRVF